MRAAFMKGIHPLVDKWHPSAKPTIPLDELIASRHNPAVAAAMRRTDQYVVGW